MLVYAVGFPLEGNSGKNKAAREKSKMLNKLYGDENFMLLSPRPYSSLFMQLLGLLYFDIKISVHLISLPRKITMIQRIPFMPLTLIIQCLKDITVINEVHADYKDEIPHIKMNIFKKIVLRLFIPFFNLNLKLGDGIIYNHPHLKRNLDLRFKVPSIFTYNGSNINEFYPEDRNEVRKKLGIDNDKVVFLFLGSVSKWHGVDYLLKIFNEDLFLNNKNFYLYIVGAKNDSYTTKLNESNVNQNIIFISPVDNENARNYINASNYCMLPANQIRISPGSPLKLYDYISCGKPVLAQSDLLGYSDEVENYKLGYTLDFRNTSESIKKIIKIVNEDQENDFTLNNIHAAKNDLSWESRMKQWVKFAQSLE